MHNDKIYEIYYVQKHKKKDEDKAMKRKLATLLVLALSAGLLGGCGGNGSDTGAETKTETTDNGSNGFTNEKSNALSEVLNKEKVIAYTVSSVDKAKTPNNVYFFEDGKVTIIPGEEFALTMGDFAKLSDDEIWEQLDTVKASYAENYRTEKLSESTFQKEIETIESQIEGDNWEKAAFESCINGTWESMGYEEFVYAFLANNSQEWGLDIVSIENKFLEVMNTKGEENLKGSDILTTEEIAFISSWYDTQITEATAELETLQNQLDTLECKGPFYDLPFEFVVTTDSSGNNVQKESFVYPTLEYSCDGEVPDKFYYALDFANVEGAEKQIYDTTYHCMGLGKGEAIFCTREYIALDTVKSKEIQIDLSNDELNELFKEEVMSRYE